MKVFNQAVSAVKRAGAAVKSHAKATGVALATVGGSAMATPAAFDPSVITAKIDANVLIAVGIIGAFIVGRWTLRSMGLLKG